MLESLFDKAAAFYQKRDFGSGVSSDFFEIFNSTFFTKHLQVTASVVQWFSQHLEFHN